VVTDSEARLKWQQHSFALVVEPRKQPTDDKILGNFEAKFKVDENFTALIEKAGKDGTSTALNLDLSEISGNLDAQLRYYTFQASASDTEAQVGPPLRISAAALELEQTFASDHWEVYKMSRFGPKEVKGTLHALQANGVAFVLPRLLGYLPTREKAPEEAKVAAEGLSALRTTSVSINDETRSGKCIFLLEILQYARSHAVCDEEEKRVYRMKFLDIPQTLMRL
jgi:hypothetical protein